MAQHLKAGRKPRRKAVPASGPAFLLPHLDDLAVEPLDLADMQDLVPAVRPRPQAPDEVELLTALVRYHDGRRRRFGEDEERQRWGWR